MTEDFVFQWKMLLYPLAAICYFELLRRLDRYWDSRKPLTEEEILWNHARHQGVSEHEIFRRAGSSWSVSLKQVDEDFKSYLKKDELPHYVRDYLRKLKLKFTTS